MPRILLIDPIGIDTQVERDRRIAQDAVGAGIDATREAVPVLDPVENLARYTALLARTASA
ncbi:hypothetical protein RB608_26480 [Nocardioides sp. LHD-245]|uniref:hypothetical protein n=1 Tax=Nocardioides sp. LHD-245 TaxID=3051387 RepID=UPI0027E049EF|nr:hypothetical protein [Nocardioides sp. LHD-245]